MQCDILSQFLQFKNVITRLTMSSFSCGLDSAVMVNVAIVKMLPIPMLPVSNANLPTSSLSLSRSLQICERAPWTR